MSKHLPIHKSAWSIAIIIAGLLLLSPGQARARQDKPQPKAWLGVAIQDVTESVAKKNNLSDKNGAYVADVPEESPAETAGIKKGDVIVELNHKSIEDADALVSAVEKMKVGDKADVVVVRKGEKKTLQAVLGKSPRNRQFAVTIRRPGNLAWMLGNHTTQGMQLMELNDQLSEYFGVQSGAGVLVEKVEKESAAEKAGIKAGDVLQKIGKRTIDDLEDVTKALARVDEGDKVAVEVLRKGEVKNLTLEVQEGDPSAGFFHVMPDAGVMRIPHFESWQFDDPTWNQREFQMQWDNVRPELDNLKQKIEGITRDMRNRGLEVGRAIRAVRVRTV